MKAAIYNKGTGAAVRVMDAVSTEPFNLNLRAGQTWRVVPDDTQISDAPALETLDPHPDLVEPA